MATSQSVSLVDDEDEISEFRVDVDGSDKSEEPFIYDEEVANLIPAFEAHPKGKDALEQIVKQVIEDFDSAWESTEKRRKKNADNWKLFTGDLPPKKFPFKDCANAHVPLMFKTLTRVTFRAFDEIFGEWGGFYTVLPVGANDDGVAEILTKHGNWQLREVVPDFYRNQMRAMLLYYTTGDVVAHSYWDEINNRPAHEILTSDDFVVPYMHVSTCPDYSDVPFRVKIMRKYRHELSPMKKVWSNVEKVLDREPASFSSDPESLWRAAAAKHQGQDMPDDQRARPYQILWYEGWTEELPGQEKPRFIRAIVDKESQQLLCLNIHEEANWQDQRRYDMQVSDLAAYKAQLSENQAAMAQMNEQRAQLQMQAQDPMADPIAMQAQMDQLSPENIAPVLPPPWMKDPEFVDEAGMPLEEPQKPARVPVHTFVHGVCIEPIVGNQGVGFGAMQADYNRAANTALSQFTDSATLGNAWGIITAGPMEWQRPFEWGPGTVNVAKGVSAAQLKDSIHELKPQPANPQLRELLDMYDGWAEQSGQAPGVLSGESGKSGETYRGISARLEQATKQLSVPTRIYAETFLKQILRNNGLLNSQFLADEEIVSVNNQLLGTVEELRLGRKLYERDYRVQITADMRFTSRVQRIAEADELVALPGTVPPMQNNLPYMQYALKKAFEARGRFDLLPFLGPMLPPPEAPLGMPPPEPPTPPGAAPMEGQPV